MIAGRNCSCVSHLDIQEAPRPSRRPPADRMDAVIRYYGSMRKALNRIRGKRVGSEPANEAEHFMACPVCGQALDMRSLAQALHHDRPRHKPMTDAELTETSR